MIEGMLILLILLGAVFCLVAAIGLVRFKDLYMRLHAATKAGAFGGSLIAIASAIYFQTLTAVIQSILVVIFFYVTTPVAAHMLSRQFFLKQQDRSKRDN